MKKKIKEQVRKKYSNQCYFCEKPSTTLHHIIPKSLGGKDQEWNLIPLCEGCHKKLHKLVDPLVQLLLSGQG